MSFIRLSLFIIFSFTGVLLIAVLFFQIVNRRTNKRHVNNDEITRKEDASKEEKPLHKVVIDLMNFGNSIPNSIVDAISRSDSEVQEEIITNMENFQPVVQERLRNLFLALGIVDKYIGELNCEYDNLRICAAENLGKIGAPQAIDPLIELMSDRKEEVSMVAAKALSKINHESVPEKLVKILSRSDKWLPARVAEGLVTQGSRSVPALLNALVEKGDLNTKLNYIEILGEIRDKEAVETLVGALDSSYAEIRAKAAMALGNIQDNSAVEGLIKALNDQIGNVRSLAALSLGRIRDKRAIQGLQNVLHDQEWKVRINAIEALGKLGEAAVPVLENLVKEKEYSEKERAVKILMELKDEVYG